MRRLAASILLLSVAACTTAPEIATAPPAAVERRVPPGMQWLYGSGEAAAASLQAYDDFRDHVLAAVRERPARGVILVSGTTLETADFVPCGDKPLAVMLDVDETAIQNLGYEFHEAFHGPSGREALRRWHRTGGAQHVLPMPGAASALRAIRDAGVTVLFNSNRDVESAASTAAVLNGAGLGPVRHGETLFLRGDVAPGSGKDPRRAAAAERFCVVAMAGDQLGDFSDLFNERSLGVARRRHLAAGEPFAGLWGNGWFMLSNPVYGPGLRGDFDDIFPVDRRWSDPEGGN